MTLYTLLYCDGVLVFSKHSTNTQHDTHTITRFARLCRLSLSLANHTESSVAHTMIQSFLPPRHAHSSLPLREPIPLPAPKHIASLILALLPLLLRRMPRRRRIHMRLHAGVRRLVLPPDRTRQRALVAHAARRRRVCAHHRIGADCRIRARGAGCRRPPVQAVRLLELELARALLAVGFCFGGAVGVDRFLREVVCASAGGDEGCPAVAVGLLAVVLCAMRCYHGLCCAVAGCAVAGCAVERSCDLLSDVLDRLDLRAVSWLPGELGQAGALCSWL